jgi:hypothetical protein
MLRTLRRKAGNARLCFGLNHGMIIALYKTKGLGAVTKAQAMIGELHMGHPGINEVEHSCPPGKLILAGFDLIGVLRDIDLRKGPASDCSRSLA